MLFALAIFPHFLKICILKICLVHLMVVFKHDMLLQCLNSLLKTLNIDARPLRALVTPLTPLTFIALGPGNAVQAFHTLVTDLPRLADGTPFPLNPRFSTYTYGTVLAFFTLNPTDTLRALRAHRARISLITFKTAGSLVARVSLISFLPLRPLGSLVALRPPGPLNPLQTLVAFFAARPAITLRPHRAIRAIGTLPAPRPRQPAFTPVALRADSADLPASCFNSALTVIYQLF